MSNTSYSGILGKKFVPSNSGEFMSFSAMFFEQCMNDMNENCEILMNAMIASPNSSGYPDEWVYGADGKPVCKSFERING